MAKDKKETDESEGKRPKINWVQVEQDYVTGYAKKSGELYYPSLSDLADKYGVERNTVAKHSMKKNWVQKRLDYQELIKKKVVEQKAVDYASEIVQFSKDMFNISKALKQAIASKVFVIQKDEMGKVVRIGYNESLNTLEMRRLAEVSIMVQTIQKNTTDDINSRKERTSLDDLVDILGDIRKQYVKDSPEESVGTADIIDGEIHPGEYLIVESV